jgi:hypothetical protein
LGGPYFPHGQKIRQSHSEHEPQSLEIPNVLCENHNKLIEDSKCPPKKLR